MTREIIQQLTRFRSIKPETDYTVRSRQLILAIRPATKPLVLTRPLAWLSGAAILALLLISLISIVNFRNTLTAQFSNQIELAQEFTNLSVNIQPQEITYHQDVNTAIASALNEITDTGPRYLKQPLLQKEVDSFNLNGNLDQGQQINDLLDKVIF